MEMEGPDRGKQARLARIANCSRGLVNQWNQGVNDSMGYEYAKNISDQLGYRVEWIMKGEGAPKKPKNYLADIEIRNTNKNDQKNIEILQFRDVGGSMGRGVILRDQPGEIQSWRVTPEWASKNVKNHTGIANLAIVTGFGDSMKPMYNPGDPLIVDTGVKSVEYDAVYFFRVGNEGFIKRLQRIPGEGIRVLSTNKEYEPWTIKPEMDFEVFARVLKAWCSSDF